MAQYTDITTNSNSHVTTLLTGGNISIVNRLIVCNNDSLPARDVDIYIENAAGVKHYFIKGLDIPVSTSFELENITFDAARFDLKILTNQDSGSGAPNITVIIQ